MNFDQLTQIDRTRDLLSAARRRALELNAYSPAWDAAMAGVEELEQQLSTQRAAISPAARHEMLIGR